MIDDLPPDVRALISASRSRLAPDAVTVARLHTSVQAAVAVGGGVAAGATAVIAKLAVVAVAVATVGTIAYVRHTSSPPAVAPTIAMTTATTTADDEPEVAPRIVAVEREPAPRPPAGPVAAPIAAAPPVPPPPPPSLAREIDLVDRASKALHRGDHAAVLAIIHTYDAETSGHGQLAQDAAAIALEAVCASNDPDAATKLAAFTRRWPHSAQHTRLAAVCHEGDLP